jgi:hypothetical protein
MRKSQILLVVGAWCVGLAGALWAVLISFAAGMKAVPRLTPEEAFSTLPLPLVSMLAAALLMTSTGARQHRRTYLLSLVPLLAIASLSLGLVLVTWWMQPHR